MRGEKRFMKLLGQVTYKPGTTFSVKRVGDGLTWGVHMPVPDSEKEGQVWKLDGYFSVGPSWLKGLSDREFHRSVMCTLTMMELHEVYEVYEFFKVDGEHFVNPHPVHPLHGMYPVEMLMMFRNSLSKAEGV